MATRKPDPVDIEVGQRIKIQRLAAGLSQTELGESIGVTFQQVQKYEKGANRVGAGRLTQIARVLNVAVNTFFEGREHIEKVAQQGVDSPLALITHPHAFRLLQAYSTLTDGELRRSIVELVERVAVKTGGHAPRRKRRYTPRHS
jgi:transcriptional regulator with XRE-family HTH domain